MLLALVLVVLAVAVAGDQPPASRLLHVHQPAEEEVRTDSTDDLGFSSAGRPPDQLVTRLWGVSDATARAGRLFLHAIDKDAFQGPAVGFEVSAVPPRGVWRAETEGGW